MLANYKAAQETGKILYVTFTTVSDYFWLLRAACECLGPLGPKALLYLAAAVSDFYIPSSELVSVFKKFMHFFFCIIHNFAIDSAFR